MKWNVGAAKQQLSRVLRLSAEEPQLICSRERPVAAVISVELYEQLRLWLDERRRRSLGQTFNEIREICRDEGYTLDVGERRNRESWITDE